MSWSPRFRRQAFAPPAAFDDRDQRVARRISPRRANAIRFSDGRVSCAKDASLWGGFVHGIAAFQLAGKVAVVAGSKNRLGKSIAMQLDLQGAKVVVSSRKKPACDEAAAEIRKAGGEAIVSPATSPTKGTVREPDRRDQEAARSGRRAGAERGHQSLVAGRPTRCRTRPFTKIMQNNIPSNIWPINLCTARHARQE